MEFKKYKMEDISTFSQGKQVEIENQYTEQKDNMKRFLRIIDFTNPNEPIRYVEDFGDRYYATKDDLVMIRYGSQTCGKVVIGKEGIIANNMFKINLDNSIVLNKYAYYYLKQDIVYNYLRSSQNSSTMPSINFGILNKLEIEIPSINNQIKIIKILNDIDKKIELNNDINNNLQELINKTFIEYFVNYNIDNVKLEFVESDIGLIPKGWSIGILSDIVEFSNGYGFDSKKMLDKNQNETFSVFKMGNINIGGGINKSKTKSWMKKEDCEGLDKFIAKKGDILMCMTDMKNSGNPLLGHTALIDKDNEFVINQRVGILRCTKGISYEYVYTLSNLDFFISDLRSRANSGVQVNLTTTGICNTQILIPDKDCIDKFNKIAKPLYEKKFNIMQQNETLEQIRDTLLPKLMNGEIDLDNIEI